jgi:hypothetical protein
MPLIQLVVILIVIGVLLWLVNKFVPMEAKHQVHPERGGNHLCCGLAALHPSRNVRNRRAVDSDAPSIGVGKK